MPNEVDTLFTFYARERDDAERKAGEILQEYPYERLVLKAYPGGFGMAFKHIPGVIERDGCSGLVGDSKAV